ncbi:hypothetical protein TIFTF001_000228 [Ficus carica]|uniref:Protein kinase domain-containing protein n=1 Tax=Ficus carica TaxID=3494 RepID=A0AA88D0P1_FICCA|nr:hypothetical protein TIFTF001_000228 [Ficus carica]
MEKAVKKLNSCPVSWVRGKCIGKGCFGTVSIGVDRSDGRVFAVKSVDRATCLPAQLEALESEIRILRSLADDSSPYVVNYLGDDESHETTSYYRNLHMEYLPGGTLADLGIADDGEKTVRSLTWCLVSALRHVHSRGIVHCDVKGKNVLLGPNHNQAKLGDFGSAVMISDKSFGAPIVPRGSPLWMAPEVVRRESQGPESDVWSLGCTVIEMITGKPAWEDRGAETLSRIGFSDDLPEFPARLSETGRDFLSKCLNRDPTRRWSCDQLLQHPFLASAAPPATNLAANSSPRCVLDWVDSEFDDQNYDSEQEDELSARERIGKLATSGGENWESDNWAWAVVRSSSTEKESAGANCCGHEEGINSEYSVFSRAERESTGTSSEYSEWAWGGGAEGAVGCVRWCVAGSSDRHGLQAYPGIGKLPTNVF